MSGVHAHGPVHAHPPRLHPRGATLLWVMFLLVAASLAPGQYAAMAWLTLLLWVSALSLSIDLRSLWKHSLWVVPLSLCALPQGPAGFATVLVRSLLCVQAGLILAWSLTPAVLLLALQDLGMPRRLLAILRFAIRYLEVLQEETSRLNRARELRQIQKPSLGRRWKTTGQLVGTLFLRTLERAERVFQAMRSRGYRGHLPSPTATRAWRASDTMGMLHGLAYLALTLCCR